MVTAIGVSGASGRSGRGVGGVLVLGPEEWRAGGGVGDGDGRKEGRKATEDGGMKNWRWWRDGGIQQEEEEKGVGLERGVEGVKGKVWAESWEEEEKEASSSSCRRTWPVSSRLPGNHFRGHHHSSSRRSLPHCRNSAPPSPRES